MVEIVVDEEKLILGVPFARNSFARWIEFPFEKVAGVEIDFSLARDWLKRLDFLADFVPVLKREGAYYEDGNCVYWEVKNANKTIVINLQNEAYEKLIVEVMNPKQAIEIIENALRNKAPEVNKQTESADDNDDSADSADEENTEKKENKNT